MGFWKNLLWFLLFLKQNINAMGLVSPAEVNQLKQHILQFYCYTSKKDPFF